MNLKRISWKFYAIVCFILVTWWIGTGQERQQLGVSGLDTITGNRVIVVGVSGGSVQVKNAIGLVYSIKNEYLVQECLKGNIKAGDKIIP